MIIIRILFEIEKLFGLKQVYRIINIYILYSYIKYYEPIGN